jgi:hypothetical protein
MPWDCSDRLSSLFPSDANDFETNSLGFMFEDSGDEFLSFDEETTHSPRERTIVQIVRLLRQLVLLRSHVPEHRDLSPSHILLVPDGGSDEMEEDGGKTEDIDPIYLVSGDTHCVVLPASSLRFSEGKRRRSVFRPLFAAEFG